MKAVDMFCGLSAWSTAAKRTGRVDVTHGVNHSPLACEFFRRSHPESIVIEQDVAEVALETLGRPDWVFASPACQGFSTNGQPARKGTGGNGKVNISQLMTKHKGHRNTTMSVVSVADVLRPRVLLVENVVELLKWHLFDGWRSMIEACGYTVRVHVLNAQNYGVAQDRPRVVITASLCEAIDLDERHGDPVTLRSCLDLDESPEHRWFAIDKKKPRTRELIRSKQRESGMWSGVLNNVGDGVRMRSFDDVSPTLTTKSGSQIMVVDGDRVRIINPSEMARIQGWKDGEVELPPQREKASILIGNAVPVGLAQGVIEQALEVA